MGDELSTYDEWHYEGELAWNIRQYPDHDASARFVRDMTLVYKYHAPLWQADYSTNGFYWIQADNADQPLYIFARVANDSKVQLVVVMNCTPNTYDNYRIGVPEADFYEEVINSDKDIYGGSNRINPFHLPVQDYGQDNQAHSILMTIQPLGISILKPIYVPKPVVEEVKEEKEEKPVKKAAPKKKVEKTEEPEKKAAKRPAVKAPKSGTKETKKKTS
jgi:1,4-alpha-glucan branching enzyme